MAPLNLPWLKEQEFPDPETALKNPNGLLAAGGDLSIERLLLAYRSGIFPWYSDNGNGDGEPILWWSPDPRTVIFPGQLHISRSLQKTLRKKIFKVTFDQAFSEVIEACSLPRPVQAGNLQTGTWITKDMKQAYINLHKAGYAHSAECWSENKLVGGIYGVVLGKCFFGESMFSTVTDASKVAIATLENHLQKNDFKLLDCQVYSEHVGTLGAVEIPRKEFIQLLDLYAELPSAF